MQTKQGEAIRITRLAMNMTQAHLAGLAGVSEKTVRRAEAGERIAADSVRSLCAALALDAENLPTGTQPESFAPCPPDPGIGSPGFAIKAGTSLLAISSVATMTVLVFEIPAGLVTLALAVCCGAAVALLVVAALTLHGKPILRQRILGTGAFKAYLSMVDSIENPGRFAACLAATPPALAAAIHALRHLAQEPSVEQGIGLALSLALAAVLTIASILMLVPERGLDRPA